MKILTSSILFQIYYLEIPQDRGTNYLRTYISDNSIDNIGDVLARYMREI